ncbi:MAG: DUF599 domain-containing protein [Burkholderiales bacterium]
MKVLSLLPWLDWMAVLFLLGAWNLYAWFAVYWGARRSSLLSVTNRFRHEWMLQCTMREPRMLDGMIIQSQSASPSFFASTSILIIGGLFAVLSTTNASEVMQGIPFVQQTTLPVLQFKIIVLISIFVYAFFHFSWSLRHYVIAGVVIGAMPHADEFDAGPHDREQCARRAGQLLGLAAETFNEGLRAYYFSFAALAWFFSAQVFMIATIGVIAILYRREFHSKVLRALGT